jgi:hypothetical protein
MQTKLAVYVFDDKYVADIDGFTFDLSSWLGDTDQLRSTPTATVSPATATIVSVVSSGAVVTVWISGGTTGVNHLIELDVITVLGRDCRIRGKFKVVD